MTISVKRNALGRSKYLINPWHCQSNNKHCQRTTSNSTTLCRWQAHMWVASHKHTSIFTPGAPLDQTPFFCFWNLRPFDELITLLTRVNRAPQSAAGGTVVSKCGIVVCWVGIWGKRASVASLSGLDTLSLVNSLIIYAGKNTHSLFRSLIKLYSCGRRIWTVANVNARHKRKWMPALNWKKSRDVNLKVTADALANK